MDTLITAGQTVLIVVGGLLVRAAAVVVILAAFVAIAMPFILAFEGGRRLVDRIRGIEHVGGFEWRRNRRYAPAHLWMAERGQQVRLGFDALAARVLAHARRVDLVPTGSRVSAGDPLAWVQSGGTEVTLPAPMNGVVTSVNPRLRDNPAAAVRHPYGSGWLVEIRPDDAAHRSLPRQAEARAWFGAEAAKLTYALEHAHGYAAADGGEPLVPDHQLMEDEHVEQLARDFLGVTVTKPHTQA